MCDEIPPSLKEDYEAARELVDRLPNIPEGKQREQTINFFVFQRTTLGPRRFRIVNHLDPPRHIFERLELEYRTDKISEEEFGQRWHEVELQPVNLETFSAYLNAAEDRVFWFSRLLQLALEHESQHRRKDTERQTKRFIFEIRRDTGLPTQQCQLITEFLEEIRVEQGTGMATLQAESAACACSLSFQITQNAADAWESFAEVAHLSQTRPEYTRSITTSELFMSEMIPKLPKLQALIALLREEFALGRHHFKQLPTPQAPNPQIVNEITVAPTFSVTAESNLHVEVPQFPSVPKTKTSSDRSSRSSAQSGVKRTPKHAPKLKNWAVGIESEHKWWLFHCSRSLWMQRRKVGIPKGNPESLMMLLADQGGAMRKAEAMQQLRH